MHAQITLGRPDDARVVVDGQDLTRFVGALRVTRMDGAAELVASPGTWPTLSLDLSLCSAEVSVAGDVLINATPVSDEIGREIYELLKARYEGESEPAEGVTEGEGSPSGAASV